MLVQAASVQDPVGAAPVLAQAKATAPQLQLLWADARYQGPLVATAAAALGLRVEVVRAPPGTKGFVVLPRRWVVERSFGWLSKYRRVAGRDYETNPRVSEAIIKACFCHLMLRRLAKEPPLKHSDLFLLFPLRVYTLKTTRARRRKVSFHFTHRCYRLHILAEEYIV